MSWIGTRVGAQDAQYTVKVRHQVADALRLAGEARHTEEESTSEDDLRLYGIRRRRLALIVKKRHPSFMTRRRTRRQGL
jgi:hypothetical protein